MLQTKVILSSVSNLSDARYASGMGVDYIGFSINPENPMYVTVNQAKTICEWLSGVSIIGDIGDSVTSDMLDYGTSFVQTSNEKILNELDEPILELRVSTENINEVALTLRQHASKASFFILIVESEILSIFQQQISDLCSKYTIYISTEYDSESLAYVLSDIKPTGIVLFGSVEEKPGFSSYDGIADILEQLEEEG